MDQPTRSNQTFLRVLIVAALCIIATTTLSTLTDIGVRELIEMLR